MKKLVVLFVSLAIICVLNSCATLIGGSSYTAHVVAVDHPNHLRPNPRTLLGRSLAFSYSQSEAAMSCLHRLVRWQASMAAVYFTRRSYASLHNQLNILSPLRGSATAPYTFTEQHPRPLRHRGRRPTISYALGTHSCRRFASSRGLIP